MINTRHGDLNIANTMRAFLQNLVKWNQRESYLCSAGWKKNRQTIDFTILRSKLSGRFISIGVE